jgi:D-alanyl-lipoteichoic acid acyltransferase DltB (MBOAT superfamily)
MTGYVSFEWLVWIWLTVGLYWLAPRDVRPFVLMGISLLFMGSAAPMSAVILIAFCGLTHVAGNLMKPTGRTIAVAAAFIVAVVVAFKVNQTVDMQQPGATILIPLGLSYYSFRCLHFLIERYKGRIAVMPLTEVAAYLFFLPTFLIGPIHRFDTFHADRRRQRFDPALLSLGLERIVQGYAKIVILGNYGTGTLMGGYIADLADPASAWAIYLGIVQSGLNLYFQFSGHTDIAIGFALLLGFRIMENFHWPYLQPNISAFWQSWHRSLSLWCREYIYGVVVAHTRSPALGALGTMVVIGLWHEISLRFLLWGAYHGVALIVWQRWQDFKLARQLSAPPGLARPLYILSVLATVHFVWFGFVILTAPSVGDALDLFRRFAGALQP